MDISPQTIRQVEFREKKLGGYHQDDVDEFLERMASGLEILQERLRLATDRAVRAEAAAGESREDDDTLRRTLVLAQRTADLAVKEGREQAARMVESAQSEAASITSGAEEEARRLVEDAQAEARADVARLDVARTELDHDVDRLIRYIDECRARAKAVLSEAAANLDAALSFPERPVLSDAAPAIDTGVDADDDGDDEPVPPRPTFDRDLLAEVIDHGRGDSDPPGRSGWPRPS